LRDGARVVSGNSSCVHDALEPGVELLIEVGEGRERSRSEERFSDVSNFSLHAALFVAARDAHRGGREVIVPGELEDARMESDEISLSLEHDTFQIIVEHRPRNTVEPLEGST